MKVFVDLFTFDLDEKVTVQDEKRGEQKRKEKLTQRRASGGARFRGSRERELQNIRALFPAHVSTLTQRRRSQFRVITAKLLLPLCDRGGSGFFIGERIANTAMFRGCLWAARGIGAREKIRPQIVFCDVTHPTGNIPIELVGF